MQNSKRYRKLKNKTGKNKLVKIYGVKKQLYVMIKTRKLYVISKGKMMKLSKYKAMKKTANSKKKQVKRKTVKRAPAKKKTFKKKKTAGMNMNMNAGPYGPYNDSNEGDARKVFQILAAYDQSIGQRNGFQAEFMRWYRQYAQDNPRVKRNLRFVVDDIIRVIGNGEVSFVYNDRVRAGAIAFHQDPNFINNQNNAEKLEARMSIDGAPVPYPFR